MARKSVEEIVRQQMPGYEVASAAASESSDRDAHEAPSDVDAASRSVEALKLKYLGQDSGLDDAIRIAGRGADGPDDDVEIVPVRPVAPPSDADPPVHTKSAVVSKRAGKVIGEQG